MTTRRSFLGSILALAAAPAIVRAESLMPVVRPIWVPRRTRIDIPRATQVDWWASSYVVVVDADVFEQIKRNPTTLHPIFRGITLPSTKRRGDAR
jgi:hypothetical protein